MNRSLFLAILVLSMLSAQPSSAAESAPAQPKTQAMTQAKTEPQKPVAAEVKSLPAPKTPAVHKNVREGASKATTPASPKKTIVTGAATVKTTTFKAANDKASEKNSKSVKRMPASALVPPPPPDTPTLMGLPEGDYDSLANLEYMSLSAMKERQKQLNTQLLDAQEELKTKQSDAEEVKSKATQFETLYSEGVISKHELEVTKKDASEVDARISRAKMRVEDLQSNINRLNDRLKEQERRVAKVKKSTPAGRNKLAINKKNAPKAADKAQPKVGKAEERAGIAKPDAVQAPVKSDKPVKSSTPSTEIKSDEL